MTEVCKKCEGRFKKTDSGYSFYTCKGGCGGVYHPKCCGLKTDYEENLVIENQYLVIMCEDCQEKKDQLLKGINNIEALIKEIRNSFGEQLKLVENLVEGVKNIEIDDSKIVHEIKKVCADNNKQSQSFADVVKQLPSVMFKPVRNQDGVNVEKVIKDKIDPVVNNIKVSRWMKNRDGSVIISCDDDKSAEKLKDIGKENLNNDYEIDLTQQRGLRIKIVNISEKMSDEELIAGLKQQNELLKNSAINVKAMYKTNRSYKPFNAVIEVDVNVYNVLIFARKVNLGWDKCAVFDGIFVRRCYKCLGFGHKSTVCSGHNICAECAEVREEQHICSNENKKCINCIKVNKDTKLDLDINHSALDTLKCKVYQRKMQAEKRKLL